MGRTAERVLNLRPLEPSGPKAISDFLGPRLFSLHPNHYNVGPTRPDVPGVGELPGK